MPHSRSDELLIHALHEFGANTPTGYERCVSTAYYAVFHAVCHTAADLFGHEDIQNHVCRCIGHHQIKSALMAVRSGKGKYAARKPVSSGYGAFCNQFARLQSLRTDSDYAAREATLENARRTATETIATAELAMKYVDEHKQDKDFQWFMVELLCLKCQAG